LLCERRGEQLRACGECVSCHLFAAATHPDYLLVRPEEDKQQISVEQVRLASERLTITSHRRGYRVAIIDPAHQLTTSAANALLKTLEEPGMDTMLILLSSKLSNVLPTLRSRCQRLAVHAPSAASAMSWLRDRVGREVSPELLSFTGGAPLKALAYADGRFEELQRSMPNSIQSLLGAQADIVQVTRAWNDEYLQDRLTWLDWWLSHLLRQKIAGSVEQVTSMTPNADMLGLPSGCHLLNISGVYSLLDRLRELKAQLARTALQKELALEQLLIGMLQVFEQRVSAQ
jgi:DNA polymerase-3 subunit delta'